MGPEAKFYRYFKKNTPNISYTRIENTIALGTPDVLAYNKNNTFFTIEFKVTKSKKDTKTTLEYFINEDSATE